MAARKEKSKEAKIKSEKTRLKGIFKDLDENKKKLVTPLIEKAAFMSIELDELQNVIEETGWTSEYKNGENQYGTKKSPEAETYICRVRSNSTDKWICERNGYDKSRTVRKNI